MTRRVIRCFAEGRDDKKIEQEALLDGLYVIRTSVPKTTLSAESVVLRYKDLCKVERAFRSLRTLDRHVLPIHHRLERRVRAQLREISDPHKLHSGPQVFGQVS